MPGVVTKLRTAARVHIQVIVLHADAALTALDDLLRPRRQLHGDIVLFRLRQESDGMRGVHPAIAAIGHAQPLRIQRLKDDGREDKTEAHIFRSDYLQPAPKHVFRFRTGAVYLIGSEHRLFYEAAADRFLQNGTELIHRIAVDGFAATPKIAALIVPGQCPSLYVRSKKGRASFCLLPRLRVGVGERMSSMSRRCSFGKSTSICAWTLFKGSVGFSF